LGGEQSGHLIWLDGHVTGDGLVAGLLLCRALRGRSLSDAVAVMPRFPQAMQNLPRTSRGPLPEELLAAVEGVNAELDGAARAPWKVAAASRPAATTPRGSRCARTTRSTTCAPSATSGTSSRRPARTAPTRITASATRAGRRMAP